MTTPVEVHVAEGSRTVADAVLASLPLSYAASRNVSGSVAVLAGTPDWPSAAAGALDRGAVAVIVVEPQPADTASLRTRTAPLVVLDSRWAANPVVDSAARALAAVPSDSGRIECRVRLRVGSPLAAALLDQLSLIRALVGEAADVRVLTHSVHGYAAEASAGGRPVDLSVVCTDAVPESATVRLLTGDGSIDLTIPTGETARPAQLSMVSREGVLMAPTLYESGHRATWRRVHELLERARTITDLTEFEADRRAAVTAFQQADDNRRGAQ